VVEPVQGMEHYWPERPVADLEQRIGGGEVREEVHLAVGKAISAEGHVWNAPDGLLRDAIDPPIERPLVEHFNLTMLQLAGRVRITLFNGRLDQDGKSTHFMCPRVDWHGAPPQLTMGEPVRPIWTHFHLSLSDDRPAGHQVVSPRSVSQPLIEFGRPGPAD